MTNHSKLPNPFDTYQNHLDTEIAKLHKMKKRERNRRIKELRADMILHQKPEDEITKALDQIAEALKI